MSKTATINVTLSVQGDGINDNTIPLASWQGTNSPADRMRVTTVAAGDYDLLIPPGTTYVIVQLPTGVTAILKGQSSDLGCNQGSLGGLLMLLANTAVQITEVINFSAPCTFVVWYV